MGQNYKPIQIGYIRTCHREQFKCECVCATESYSIIHTP